MMSKQEQMDKIQALVKDIKYTMMTTRTNDDHLHSCPMNTTETSIGAKEIGSLVINLLIPLKTLSNTLK